MSSARLPPGLGGAAAGADLVLVALVGTATFAIAAGAGVVATDPLGPVVVVVSLALFVAGCALFLWSFLQAVGRSRREAISVADLYFLGGGVAPPEVRRALLGALAVQVVVAVGAAVLRPYTALAFGILVPVYGLGCAGAWAARHGTFQPRDGG